MKKIASRKDPRIIDLLIAHGVAGYGLYVMLVEYLGERKSFHTVSDIRRIAYELHADAEVIRSIIRDFNLFDVDHDGNISREGDRKKVTVEKIPTVQPVIAETIEKMPKENANPVPVPIITSHTLSRSERRRQERLRRKNSA